MTIEPTPPPDPGVPVQYHVTYERQRVNHVLHLLLSIITFGLWLPIWLLITIFASGQQEQRVTTVYNQPPAQQATYPPRRPVSQPARPAAAADDGGYDFDNTQPTNWLRLGQIAAVVGAVFAGIMALGGSGQAALIFLVCIEAVALGMWLWGKRHDRRV